MKVFPIVFMLVAFLFKKSIAGLILSDQMKFDERIRDYIYLNEHETLRLGCFQGHDDGMFTVPVTDSKRITEYSNSSSSESTIIMLIVKNVTESDTGTYTCHSPEQLLSDATVYVFVHGSKVFVPPDNITIPFIEEGSFIPCRTTQLVNHKNVRLYINGKFIETNRNDYDPRYGFRIRDNMQDSVATNMEIYFECKFENETYQETKYFSVEEWIHPMDYTFMYNSEINVNQKESKSDVFLQIGGPLFTAFNDYFFRKESQVEISCTRSFTDHVDDFLVYRTKSSSNYTRLNPIKCELLSETRSIFDNEKRQQCSYRLKLVENIQVECKNDKKNLSKTANLYLADITWTTFHRSTHGGKLYKDIILEDDVNLVCVIPAGPGDWNAYWRKSNETEKKLTITVKYVGNSKLIIYSIRNLTTDQEGTYECVIEKGQMSLVLKKTIVDIPGLLIPDDIFCLSSSFRGDHCRYYNSVRVNEQIELHCHFGGRPFPKYQWYKNRLPYTHGVKNGSRLIIENAREEDDGVFKCVATVPGKIGTSFTHLRVNELTEDRFLSYKTKLFLVGLACVLLIFFAYICVQYKTIKQKKVTLHELYKELSYNPKYEVDLEKLEILEHLGTGRFGRVNRGLLQEADPHSLTEDKGRLQVAVKRAKTATNLKEQQMMVDELNLMCAIPKHPNVVALVGAVTKQITKGLLYVIIEYIDGGDLRNYLRKLGSNFKDELCNNDIVSDVPEKESCEKDELLVNAFDSLSTSDLLSIGLQIATGMEWLASVSCVHRDLACRNVLITKTKIIKIADYGFTKKFTNKAYNRTNPDAILPIPTMSPKAIGDMKFTEKSDVWSFGLCLYEIFTLGGIPYPSCGTIEEIIEFIENGHRNAQPKYCPDEIYKLMGMCWEASPTKRPIFKECVVQDIERKLQLEREKQQELDSWTGKSLRAEGVEDKETEV